MQRAHKIRIYPNKLQATYLKKCVGVARFSYNWALSEWNAKHKLGEKVSAYKLEKNFNAIKKKQFPFVCEVSKFAAERSFLNLDTAFKRFFKGGGYPRFKKKGVRDSFYTAGSNIKHKGKYIKLPKISQIRMAEELRLSGTISNVVVSTKAGMWFASFSVAINSPKGENQSVGAVGIDLGISKLATLSNGEVFENLKVTNKFKSRLRRANKALARKKKNSKNRGKAKRKLQKVYVDLANTRSDNLHKLTSSVSKRFNCIGLEDLNVKGMAKNRRLSKALLDSSFGEIKRQFEYKANSVAYVGRFFPSTKLCRICGQLHTMPLSVRTFNCDCGYGPIDRDLNAAKNILAEIVRQGLPDLSEREKPVETVEVIRSMKQEGTQGAKPEEVLNIANEGK